jgi:hypothetical protein
MVLAQPYREVAPTRAAGGELGELGAVAVEARTPEAAPSGFSPKAADGVELAGQIIHCGCCKFLMRVFAA